MKRLVALVCFVSLFIFGMFPSAGLVVADPNTCEGYPEPRVFLESQGWWITEGAQAGTDFGHVHMGSCFPLGRTLSGTVEFDVRLTMHMNPGELFHIVPFICRTHSNINCVNEPVVNFTPPLTCAVETCEFWQHFAFDTAQAPDGWASFRFRTEVREPDGNVLRASNDWLARLANGNPVVNFKPAGVLTGKGWYTEGEYSTSDITAGYPKPPTGPWVLTYRCRGSQPATDCLVTIDPAFHMGDVGMIVRRDPTGGKRTITIPTGTLAPGQHFLVIRTEAEVCQPVGCTTKAGLLKVPFQVT